VHGADHLEGTQMAALAGWTNLSETTFLPAAIDPDADYRMRISLQYASYLCRASNTRLMSRPAVCRSTTEESKRHRAATRRRLDTGAT
jgi:hypothetical protein